MKRNPTINQTQIKVFKEVISFEDSINFNFIFNSCAMTEIALTVEYFILHRLEISVAAAHSNEEAICKILVTSSKTYLKS